MLEYLLLGFELDLYGPWEYAMVFAYCTHLIKRKQDSMHRFFSGRPKELKINAKKSKKDKTAAGASQQPLIFTQGVHSSRFLLLTSG
jgi:hypothetical protein